MCVNSVGLKCVERIGWIVESSVLWLGLLLLVVILVIMLVVRLEVRKMMVLEKLIFLFLLLDSMFLLKI